MGLRKTWKVLLSRDSSFVNLKKEIFKCLFEMAFFGLPSWHDPAMVHFKTPSTQVGQASYCVKRVTVLRGEGGVPLSLKDTSSWSTFFENHFHSCSWNQTRLWACQAGLAGVKAGRSTPNNKPLQAIKLASQNHESNWLKVMVGVVSAEWVKTRKRGTTCRSRPRKRARDRFVFQ